MTLLHFAIFKMILHLVLFKVLVFLFMCHFHKLSYFLADETARNYSVSSTDGCDTVHCTLTDSWIQDNGYTPRSDWNQILIYYTVLRCLIDVLRASSIMMFEVKFKIDKSLISEMSFDIMQGAVVVTIKQLGGDYGLQKLFGTFGAIIWGPVSGQIIDMASSASGTENYEPIFYTFFIMRLISAALILKLNLSFKKPAKKVFKVNKTCRKIFDIIQFIFPESGKAYNQASHSVVLDSVLCMRFNLGIPGSIPVLVLGRFGIYKVDNGNISGDRNYCWYSPDHC